MDASERIMQDTISWVQFTLDLLPHDMLQARLERALDNDISCLQKKARWLQNREPLTPWTFQTSAPERHLIWQQTLQDELVAAAQGTGTIHGADPVYRMNTTLAVLMGCERLLTAADAALQAIFAGDASAGAAVVRQIERHNAVYATPHLPRFDCNFIDHQIVAGRNPLTERDAAWLHAMGITHRVDLREAKEWTAPRFGEEALACLKGPGLWRPAPDGGAPSLADLDAVWDYLTQVLADPGARVYIHCRAGQERTGAVLVAYYGRRYGMTYEEAFAAVRARRPNLNMTNQESVTRTWIRARSRAR
ncbi:MAG: Dual specificity phosphatase, catalytic domain [Symbiobacteriaceae bacterium]|jgi:protein-tyrosine phosphatase|nr:Dual specificity phosphatase, catalytic domain [Symbiobacteriaceae bacterium]